MGAISSRDMWSANRSTNSSATSSWTMKRLAHTQLWPVLVNRALTAVAAASDTSASASTTNGSEPPSSSTVFLIAAPATAAIEEPARSLPVRVTAATRRSSRPGRG